MAPTAHPLELIYNSRPYAWSFLGLDGVNMQMFGLLATSSRIEIIYGHLDDSSVLFQNRESGFYFTKILAAYTTKCSYVHLASLEYFSVSLSGQGQQIILDVVMSWDFTIASNSNVSACQHWWSSYWLCSSSISGLPSSFWARWIITHFTCETLIKATAWGSWFYLSFNPYIWPR